MILHSQTIKQKLDFASKISLIITGFAIPLSITGFNIFLYLTIVLAILAGNWREKIKSLRNNQVVTIALFIYLLLIISIPYSVGTWHDISISFNKYSKLLYLVLLMPLFSNDRWREAGIHAFLAAMIITLACSFMKMFGWIHIGNGGLGTIFTNHINTGFMMAFAAFITAHRSLEKNRWRWLYAILFLIITYHIFFMNEGRTGYLVFVALFLVFLWQKSHWKGLLAAVIAAPLLLGLVFLTSENFKHRIERISMDIENYKHQQLKENSIGLRLVFTKNSLELIARHPIVGTGVGSFRVAYNQQFPPAPDFANMANPQNEFLMIAVQLGLLGLLVFLWLFYAEWRASLKLPLRLRVLAQGMIVAFLVGCLCDTFLYLAITGYFFAYFSALFFSGINKRALLKN